MLNIEEKDWKSAEDLLVLIERNERVPITNRVDISDQWYQRNPSLQISEIKAMAQIHPDAKMGYLPNGKMAWLIQLQGNNQSRSWTVLAIYDDNHPNYRIGRDGGIKFYPLNPSYHDMQKMVDDSPISPKFIPHTLRDEYGLIWLSIETSSDREHSIIPTAASCSHYANRWIMLFEAGLNNQKVWNEFHGIKRGD